MFQVLALAENAVALALCRRKPVGALAGILVVHLAVDLEWMTGLPVLLALLNLVVFGSRRAAALGACAAAVTVVCMPYLHGEHATVAEGLVRAAVTGCTVAVGGYLRARPGRVRTAEQPGTVGPALRQHPCCRPEAMTVLGARRPPPEGHRVGVITEDSGKRG